MAELPEGFVLDAPASGPPEGFVVDQGPSWTDHVPKAVTGVPEEAVRTAGDTIATAKQDLGESLSPRQAKPDEGFWEGYGRDVLETPARFGKFMRGLGTATAIPLSPAYGAAKSLIGRPMASAIHAVGQYVNPAAAAKQTPEGIYEDIREDVGSALGTMGARAPKAPTAVPPTPAEIKTASRAGYKHPEVAAVEIRPHVVQNLASEIESALVKEGFRPVTNNASGTFREVRRMQGASGPVLVDDLDAIRRAFGKYAKNVDVAGQPTTEAAAAKLAIDRINDFLPNLKPADIIAGNAGRATQILKDARRDWASYKRASLVDTLEANAGKQAGSSYFGGNLNNSIRQAFRPYGKNNHSKIPGWTDESKTALDKVVSGGPSYSYANLTRNFGRLSPDSKLGIFGHLAASAYTGGHSVPVAIAGYAAKKMGIAATRSNVKKLQDILVKESALYQARQAAASRTAPVRGSAAWLAPSGIGEISDHRREPLKVDVRPSDANPFAP